VLFGAEPGSDPVDVPQLAVVLIAAALTAVPLAVGMWRHTRREAARQERQEQE
jgi:hypothetical protein